MRLKFVAFALLLFGCLPDDPARGLRSTPSGNGPRVVFNLSARPLPDIPFPNDLVTRPDRRSPTGVRTNLSLVSSTTVERRLRERALYMDGFGTSGVITVRFDAPLDLRALAANGRDSNDDPILLVDVSEGPTFGERIPLDLGRGYFPWSTAEPNTYFSQDPRAGQGNLLLETVDEDLDGDGVLSPTEDLDADGVLDRPNVLSPDDDPDVELLTWYERETNTLLLRPILPLRPAHTYAVVLTERVRGADGQPIRSPFAYVHHTRQTEAVERLGEALKSHNISIEQIAFTWTFTTQSIGRVLDTVRDGLAGQGGLAELAALFSPDVVRVDPLRSTGQDRQAILPGNILAEVIRAIGTQVYPEGDIEALAASMGSVKALVAGAFTAPDLLLGAHSRASELDDGTLRFDFGEGSVPIGSTQVPFWCTVPQVSRPGPVVLFAHELGSSRAQALLWAGTFAAWGLTTCTIDAPGHGVRLSATERADLDSKLADLEAVPIRERLEGDRAVDLNNDGVIDPGGDTYGTDPMHTRDMLRQGVVEWLQFIRVLRAFDGSRRWQTGGPEGQIAGDFDGDGAVDFGGPDVDYFMTGLGQGAMTTVITAGVSPEISAVAPVSGGGGIADMAVRGTLLRDRVILPILGPLVVGVPSEGRTKVRFVVSSGGELAHGDDGQIGLPFADLGALVPGDRIGLTNLRADITRYAVVDGEGGFQIAIAADGASGADLAPLVGLDPVTNRPVPVELDRADRFGDLLRLEVFDVSGRSKLRLETFEMPIQLNGASYPAGSPLVAIAHGWGLRRQTPELRRFLQVYQVILDDVDPINYARRLVANQTRTLVIGTVGDTVIPVANSVSLARAAGAITAEQHARLARSGVLDDLPRRGGVLDPDNLSNGTDAQGNARLDPPLRATTATGSGLRIALLQANGGHGFGGPTPQRVWDGSTYLANLIGRFFARGVIKDEGCLATAGGCR